MRAFAEPVEAAACGRRLSMARRGLTDGEIKLARSVFAGAIDYKAVRVYDRGYAFVNALGNMSYQGNIYLPGGFCRDFSVAALPEQRLFIHEMVHVWQHQNKLLNLAVAAVREAVRHRFQYAKAYLFRLEAGRDLLDYGMEQQAAVIEEYFLRRHGGAVMGRCLNEAGSVPALLELVLARFLANPAYGRRLLPATEDVWADAGGELAGAEP